MVTPLITKVIEGVETIIAPSTAEDKSQKMLDLKARSTLLMGIPNEHQLKFNSIKDAKSLLQAIEKSSEVLDQTFDRLQKLISQLEIRGESISKEDVNQKFLRSLSPEWNTHTIVWRNKPEFQVNTVNYSNIDNLSNAVICAFLASQPSSPQLVNEDLKQIHPDDLEKMDLKWKMVMLTMRAIRILIKIGRRLTINGNETIGFDKSNVKCYNCQKRGHFARDYRAPRHQDNKQKETIRRNVPVETPTSIALVSCDGLGLGYNAVPPPYTGNLMPLKPDLSGLEKIVNEPIVTWVSCDGLGGYDWSDQAEEGQNYALMAYISTSSDSK
nr:hypothetical protein [Tanacetum cinerariifolium]